jgi:nucleoside-diphosphate-sugar epimerase
VHRLLAAAAPETAPKPKVIAIDTIRGVPAGATWRLADVRDPSVAGKLTGVHVLIHLDIDLDGDSTDATERQATNVRGTATILTAAAASGVRHVVLVTSAMVYGAQVDNPVPLLEDAELTATPDTSLIGDLLEMERLAAQAPRTHPGLRVTVLRPAILVGPGIDSVFTRHFEEPRLLAVKGARSCWQFCHVDDLMAALVLVATATEPAAGSEGICHAVVGSTGWLEQADVERITGKRHIELPAVVAFGTAERLHRLGLTPASAADLQFLVHPWVVETNRLKDLGFAPSFDNEAALRAAIAESAGRTAIGGHRLGRKDAAAGAGAALGATVAVVGTAALVRRARRRRRG